MRERMALKAHEGVLSTGRQTNWATHFGQLGDNIGRVFKDVNVGKIFEIISF